MENKKIPKWFYKLFHDIAIKHNLPNDLSEHYLEGCENIYFDMIKDIESGNDDVRTRVLSNISDHYIGNFYINDEDEGSKIYNGTQFLFRSEFFNALYSSILKDDSEINSIPQIEFDSIKSKILVLRELGVIELIKEKFDSNNTKVAECLGVIINEKPSSIRGILSNIRGTRSNNTNPENIPALENAIKVLNNLGCHNEVMNLQNKLGELISDKENK